MPKTTFSIFPEMKDLITILLQFGNLTTQQIDFIKSKTTELELKKDGYFVEAGETFEQVAFIVEGVLRISYYNNKGEEITKYFCAENHFIANPYKGEPISEYIQAATDCKLIVFSPQNWKNITQEIPEWESMTSKIFQKAIIEKMDRRSSLVSEDATTRYLTFLKKFPNLVNRIPLVYIASYLGITQQSLSRIRKNIN